MSKQSRYDFAKKVYSDYIVLIQYRDKYITYSNDKFICDYIGFFDSKKKYNFKVFLKKKINYLILDELDIVVFQTFELNHYDKYVYIVNLKRIVKKIGNRLMKN